MEPLTIIEATMVRSALRDSIAALESRQPPAEVEESHQEQLIAAKTALAKIQDWLNRGSPNCAVTV